MLKNICVEKQQTDGSVCGKTTSWENKSDTVLKNLLLGEWVGYVVLQ